MSINSTVRFAENIYKNCPNILKQTSIMSINSTVTFAEKSIKIVRIF
jgi:hypothetical protein